jgi:hypothetical protein
VHVDARRELAGQMVLQMIEQLVAATRRAPQRGVRFLGGGAQIFGAGLVLADHHAQRPELDDLLDRLPALARVERIEPGEFLGA